MSNPIISKAKTAYYEDASYSTITVEWEGEDGKLRTHSIPADEKNSDYQDLVAEGWDEETLQKTTVAYKKNASRAMNRMIHTAAAELAEQMFQPQVEAKLAKINERLKQAEADQEEASDLLKTTKRQIDNSLFDLLMQNNKEKDEVFKVKLWALEQDFMQDITAEEKKTFRKCTTMFGCFQMINEIINK